MRRLKTNYGSIASFLLCVFALRPGVALSNAQNILVLGVIAATNNAEGVALIKDMSTQKVTAVKGHNNIQDGLRLIQVNHKNIVVENQSGQQIRIEVGGDLNSGQISPNVTSSGAVVAVNPIDLTNAPGIEKENDTIKIAKDLKEKLIGESLAKILMQAAAVPYVADGRLKGFQLWEIEPNSVFDYAGLKNGDLITSINGYDIRDVGTTIRQLTALKKAQEAKFEYERNGIKQSINVMVQ